MIFRQKVKTNSVVEKKRKHTDNITQHIFKPFKIIQNNMSLQTLQAKNKRTAALNHFHLLFVCLFFITNRGAAGVAIFTF